MFDNLILTTRPPSVVSEASVGGGTTVVSKQPGSFVNRSFFGKQTGMDSKHNQFVSIARQLQVQADIDFITLVNIHGESIVPEMLGNLANKCIIWLKVVELVNNSCLGPKGFTGWRASIEYDRP